MSEQTPNNPNTPPQITQFEPHVGPTTPPPGRYRPNYYDGVRAPEDSSWLQHSDFNALDRYAMRAHRSYEGFSWESPTGVYAITEASEQTAANHPDKGKFGYTILREDPVTHESHSTWVPVADLNRHIKTQRELHNSMLLQRGLATVLNGQSLNTLHDTAGAPRAEQAATLITQQYIELDDLSKPIRKTTTSTAEGVQITEYGAKELALDNGLHLLRTIQGLDGRNEHLAMNRDSSAGPVESAYGSYKALLQSMVASGEHVDGFAFTVKAPITDVDGVTRPQNMTLQISGADPNGHGLTVRGIYGQSAYGQETSLSQEYTLSRAELAQLIESGMSGEMSFVDDRPFDEPPKPRLTHDQLLAARHAEELRRQRDISEKRDNLAEAYGEPAANTTKQRTSDKEMEDALQRLEKMLNIPAPGKNRRTRGPRKKTR